MPPEKLRSRRLRLTIATLVCGLLLVRQTPSRADQPPDGPTAPTVSLTPRATLTGHPGLVYCVRFSPDGKTLVSGSFGGSKPDTVIAWSVADGGKRKVAIPVGQPVTQFGLAAGGKQVAVGKDDYVGLFDIKSGRETGQLPGPGQVSALCVTASEKGNVVAAGFQNGEILVWESRGKKSKSRSLSGHSGAVQALAFSPDGKQLGSGDSQNSARVWDVATGKPKYKLELPKADSPVVVIRYSNDGETLATSGDTVHFWDPANGSEKHVLPADALLGTRSLAFSPDGKLLASTSVNLKDYKRGKISVWDLTTGHKLTEVSDPDGLVYDVVFSPDGKLLASGGGDTVKLWTISRDGPPD